MKTYNEVIEHFTSVPRLARALGVSRQAVHLWDGHIPKGRAYQIESLTGGKFNATKYLSSLKREAA